MMDFVHFPQSERSVFGRQYSDDEDEEAFMSYRSSDLMGTALASESRSSSRSEPLKKLLKAAPKVRSGTPIRRAGK